MGQCREDQAAIPWARPTARSGRSGLLRFTGARNVRAAQAEKARAHGIETFCYYHYWFGGKPGRAAFKLEVQINKT